MHHRRWMISVAVASATAFLVVFRPAGGIQRGQDDQLQLVLHADERRDGSAATLKVLLEALESTDSLTRIVAVRALGRVERPEWLGDLRDPLWHSRPEVRTEAANAIGQAVFGRSPGRAYELLTERLSVESDAHVRGRIAQTLGRLSYSSIESVRLAEEAILAATTNADMLGVTRGFESLSRQQRRGGYLLSHRAVQFLVELVNGASGTRGAAENDARVRRMALSALVAGGGAHPDLLQNALGDPDPGVRRIAIRGVGSLQDEDVRATLIMQAPADISPSVRYEILRLFGRFMRSEEGCQPLRDTMRDPNPHVGLLAVDLMSEGCLAEDNIESVLGQIVAALPPSAEAIVDNWHYPVHALISLSNVAPDAARQALGRFENHSQWQVRANAARVAATIGEVATLYRLAQDDHWNVRTAAVDGLNTTVGHDADSVYIGNLASHDYQLVMTAARNLEGTSRTDEALRGLFAAMARITGDQEDTSRDPRRMMMTRIAELGSRSHAAALRPYLSDFDHVIAEAAAEILSGWLGEEVTATPRPLQRPDVPSVSTLREWSRTIITLHMRGGGNVAIALRPFDAPTNVARFVRLAEAGYFNGLTFHRVEPNFVIQGGSAGANEYDGDAMYSRDELTARGHWRGTVGLSTRGRNTGDGQIFVNLIDNVRLDHNYTIFGDVVSGMDVVDAVMEGATIERVSLQIVAEGR